MDRITVNTLAFLILWLYVEPFRRQFNI